MKISYWIHRTLWLVGQPSVAVALAVFVYVWLKVGYIGIFSVVPSFVVLVSALAYRQALIRLCALSIESSGSGSAGSDLS